MLLGVQQGIGHLERGLHPWGDDQQQAHVPWQALPGPDLQDPGGARHFHQAGALLHQQSQGPAIREQPPSQASRGVDYSVPRH